MRISIFGLGYVGVVSAACLSSAGHTIIGVDINNTKIEMMNSGKSPIIEKDVEKILAESIKNNLIRATIDTDEAILNTDYSLICVGTPSNKNGSLDIKYIESVTKQIAQALKKKEKPHFLIYRSTMVPGTVRQLIIPLLEQESNKTEGIDFFVAFNPEFLRESTAVYDFNNPPKTVIGCDNVSIANEIMAIYENVPGPKISTTLEVAEMVKYVDNTFHALKITFGNEIGHICKQLGIDSHKVMSIFLQDTKLNISNAYLMPGFAFGGSCLPKDLRAMNYLARNLDLDLPLLNSMLQSNDIQINEAFEKIESFKKRKIGIAGFAFKSGTDDLRESPIVTLIEKLIGKGYLLKLYDKNVSIARLIGANKEYINQHISHISSLMVDNIDDLNDCDIIVIGNKDNDFKSFLNKSDKIIYDLVRIGEPKNTGKNYEGICW
ncbi:MAG: nucleotide sugar dehydrogenase [Spirochaetales bacterium]|nr:nucleotide sugar dehydrogenase [Spirochaetales bacterium]